MHNFQGMPAIGAECSETVSSVLLSSSSGNIISPDWNSSSPSSDFCGRWKWSFQPRKHRALLKLHFYGMNINCDNTSLETSVGKCEKLVNGRETNPTCEKYYYLAFFLVMHSHSANNCTSITLRKYKRRNFLNLLNTKTSTAIMIRSLRRTSIACLRQI